MPKTGSLPVPPAQDGAPSRPPSGPRRPEGRAGARGRKEELRLRADRLERMVAFLRRLSHADPGQTAETLVTGAPALLGAEAGALFLFDDETRMLSLCRAAPPLEPEPPPLPAGRGPESVLVHLLRHYRKPVAVAGRADVEALARRPLAPHPSDALLEKGALLLPLRRETPEGESEPEGVLLLSRKAGGWTAADLEHAALVAEAAALALHDAGMMRRMCVLAETDSLTGLYNHRHFQDEITRATALVRRYREPLSLAILDIDLFKNVNDTFGHQAGDHVLREIARAIKESVRDKVDMVARHGGEEFAVIMPNTEIQGAAQTAERIRQNVERLRIHHDSREITATLSAGVSLYDPREEPAGFIERADKALYAAKEGGRNRVCQAPAPEAP